MSRLLLLAALGLAAAPVQNAPPVPAAGHWPQWRGPSRDGVSTEKELLREWPKEGPKLVWKATGLGEGMGCPSVAGGMIFAQGNKDGKDVVSAFDGGGKVRWSVPVGPASGEHPSMRYANQRAPTVDDGFLFVTTWNGMLNCLESTTGRIVWRKDYRDFGSAGWSWGFGDSPMVDGKILVCAPGGSKGTLVALNKLTGAPVWQSTALKDQIHAALVPAEIGGVRQYVVFTYEHVAGISSAGGALLWSVERKGATAVVTPPVIHDGIVFVSSGFNVGCNAYRVTKEEAAWKVEPLYSGKQLENHHGGVVSVGDHLYGTEYGSLKCIELKTGALAWQDRSVGKGSVIVVDGLLYVRGESGDIALVEATPEGYREKGRFTTPDRTADPAHTHLVVTGGRLYVRDQDMLLCYEVRGPEYKIPRPSWNIVGNLGRSSKGPSLPPAAGGSPDAAFVPTPQDVVERMLELAKVTKGDIVYDLGSGDGRIPVTASKKYGCASVGYEIESELLKLSREKAREAKVDFLVTLVDKDLFTADLSRATVVTLYLGTSNNARLLPKLRELKAGARIVSHMHLLGADGPKPDLTVQMTSTEDGSTHTIHVWTAPLAK